MIGVVIPAHNEAAVIGRLLEELTEGVDDGRLEVVVVPNGCSDNTAAVARTYPIAVVELAAAGKAAALNAGDAVVKSLPRFYVDADVVLSGDDIVSLAAALEGEIEAVAPERTLDTSASSLVVRSYHRIWDQLDSTSKSLAGRGCYGVSELGRRRWGVFPDLIADDGFVNSRFAPSERANVAGVRSVVVAPRDVRSLLRRKRRSHLGNVQLRQIGVDVVSAGGWIDVIRRSPVRVIDAPAYVLVTLLARFLAARDAKTGSGSWGSDQSSRSEQ